jgi:hypothetical protein
MTRPYHFGVDKVHPAPALDPAKAPWSSPRGYTTSILEETNALKAANRLANRVNGGQATTRWHVPDPKRRARRQTPNCFRAVAAHMRAVYADIVTNLRFNKTKFVAKLCCLSAEVV